MLYPTQQVQNKLSEIISERKEHVKLFIQNIFQLEIIEKANIHIVMICISNLNICEEVVSGIRENFPDRQIKLFGIFDDSVTQEISKFKKLGLNDWVRACHIEEDLESHIEHYIDYIQALSLAKNNKILFNALLHNVPYMSWFKNKDSQYVKVNKAFSDHAGKSFEVIEGKDDMFVWEGKVGQRCKGYDSQVMSDGKHVVFQELIPGTRGERLFEVHKAPVVDEHNEVIGTVGVARDITEQKIAQEQIERMAYMDELTKLNNRRGLYKYIEDIRNKPIKEISMFYIDLDNFKELNDSYGHYYGDQALIDIAYKFKQTCQGSSISRIGGDEFVIIFETKLTEEELEAKAIQLIECTRKNFIIGEKCHTVSASIGVVQGSFSDNTVEDLLAKGDLALYKAKENGKNQHVIYTPIIEEEYHFSIEIEKAIQNAIKEEEIILYYQPQYTPECKLIGFEALMRWDNKAYSHIPIIEIIKIIEARNLIHDVGDYIVKKAFEFAKRVNQGREKYLLISVNISALQLMEENFVSKIKQMIKEQEVLPETIGIEITETVLLEDIDKNIKKIQELKDLGITILLDDFGTGYSSLSYLSKLPLSEMKIDRSFIQLITTSDTHKHMIRAMINMAHLINLLVVAEGIEEQEQLELLKEMNVDYIQGYLVGRPMKEVDVFKLLESFI